MVVGTVMSNLGFGKALKKYGCQTVSTKVGDRYVLEEMLKHNYSIGGEQSGHIISRIQHHRRRPHHRRTDPPGAPRKRKETLRTEQPHDHLSSDS